MSTWMDVKLSTRRISHHWPRLQTENVARRTPSASVLSLKWCWDDILGFGLMPLADSDGGRCQGTSADEAKADADQVLESRRDEAPSAAIAMLFLRPDKLRCLWVSEMSDGRKGGGTGGVRSWGVFGGWRSVETLHQLLNNSQFVETRCSMLRKMLTARQHVWMEHVPRWWILK